MKKYSGLINFEDCFQEVSTPNDEEYYDYEYTEEGDES
jgi:hypothetical protein